MHARAACAGVGSRRGQSMRLKLVAGAPPALAVRARLREDVLAHHLLLRLEARVEKALLFIALAEELLRVRGLLVASLEGENLLYAVWVRIQLEQRVHVGRAALSA